MQLNGVKNPILPVLNANIGHLLYFIVFIVWISVPSPPIDIAKSYYSKSLILFSLYLSANFASKYTLLLYFLLNISYTISKTCVLISSLSFTIIK